MVTVTVLVTLSTACSSSQTEPVDVLLQIGNAGFAAGDVITIRSVRGDRPAIEVGGTYQVEGSWTLATQPAALLQLWSTNGEVRGSNGTRIQQGTGTFSFTVNVVREGNLHVSLYPAKGGNSFGGVYFGTGANVYRGSYVPGP